MQSVDDSAKGRETLTRCIGVIFVDSVKVLTGEKCCCANTFLEIGARGGQENLPEKYEKRKDKD